MKIGGFKFGKSKEQAAAEEAEGQEIIDTIIQNASQEEAAARVHAPLQELSLDSPALGESSDDAAGFEPPAEEEAEPVKLVEVKIDPKAAPPAAAAAAAATAPATPAVKPEPAPKSTGGLADINASISDIFNNLDDEENPLANLIKSLPEVAASELIDDLKEINDIIKDWQKK